MKCESCGAGLSFAKNLPLKLFHNQVTVQCPVCIFIMVIIYNRRQQIWETEKERDERRAGWRKLKHKVDSKLTEIAASYREEGGE